jgi:hypothetical protein
MERAIYSRGTMKALLRCGWPNIVLAFGLLFGPLILVLSTLSDRTPRNMTLACAILSSGFYALLLYLTRKWWLPHLSGNPRRNAILFGAFNAALIETIFWAWEKLWGAGGVAASPDLAIDLIITMPWYIGMVFIFVRAQDRRRFSMAAVLLLGGLYELGADGFVGGMLFGGGMLNPGAWALLALAYWEFIPVYASMVLPPAIVVGTARRPPEPQYPAWLDALAPLSWLVPYSLYLAVLFVLIF